MDNCIPEENRKNKYECRIYFFKQLFSCSSVILNYFMVGTYLGAPTVVIPQIRREANSTDFISPEKASWISSTASFSGIPWVIIWSLISYHRGRKICLIILTLSTLLGNLLFYFSKGIIGLILCLALQGTLFGSVFTISVMVLSEYTSPKYRETKDGTIQEIEESMIRGNSHDIRTTSYESIPLTFLDFKQ